MKIELKDLPDLLKKLREKQGMTQVEAAKLLGSDSHRAWAAYELGDRVPSLAQTEKLLKVLGYSLTLDVKKD